MGTEPFIVGVLYESDEWSDHKLTAELEKQLASAAENGAIEGPVQVKLILMESPSCIEEALGCDLLIMSGDGDDGMERMGGRRGMGAYAALSFLPWLTYQRADDFLPENDGDNGRGYLYREGHRNPKST